MAELRFLICVENYLRALLVWEHWACWDQLMRCLYLQYLSFCLVPYKYLNVFDALICLAKIILEMSIALTLIEIAFGFLLLNFGNINPPIFVITLLSNTKHIILKHFIMLTLTWHSLKRWWLFYPSFLIIF